MNRISFYALLLATPLVLFPGVSHAATPASAFKAAPLFTPSQISLKTLPNGVRGIVKASPGSDLVNIQVWVKAGSLYETDKESGASHLLELLALRGSKNYPAAAGGDDNAGALGALRAVGGDGGSLTARDSTFFSATVAAPFAGEALKILADATLHPDLSPAAVEEAKLQAADDISSRAFDPVSGASDLAYASAFAKHPYRRPAYGSDNSVAALNQKTVHAFYDRTYVGANISVVVVGQIGAEQAQKLIAENFGSASAKKAVPPAEPVEAPFKSSQISRRRPVMREVIDLAWRSPTIKSPEDCVAMDTLLSLWREGLDANLRRVLLRDGDAGPLTPLVASYDVDYLTQRDAGLFIISLVDPADREGAVSAVLAEVKRIGESGVTPEELKRAKAELKQQYIQQSESVSGQAGALGFYDMIASQRFAVDYIDLCSRVTNADLQRVAKKYLTPDKFVRAEVSPIPRPRTQDNNSGPVITARAENHKVESEKVTG